MIKVIPPKAWPDLHDGPQLEQVKYSSGGLRGDDLRSFIKRASHHLASWVRDNPPKSGEVYVHNVALTSTEAGGPNRNNDGYTNVMLKRDHNSFEKHANLFMNHRNGDPTRGYGPVKKAWYNEPMQRVELIVALNGTKEAADRNKGLVAERTLQKLASGLDVAVSQACRVPFDRCASCGHEARTRAHYCGPENCKYGGCRDNLGRTFDDGFHLYVDNPHCTFFDISDVSDTRGADRTAFITGKVANNDLRVPGGAELADILGLVAPEYLLDRDTIAASHCLRKLASVKAPHPGAPSWADSLAVRSASKTAHSLDVVFSGGEHERHTKLADLSAAGVVLPPSQWLAVVSGAPAEKCALAFASGIDPNRDLLDRNDLHDVLCASAPVVDNRLWAEKYAWMAPTRSAHGRESQLGVLSALSSSSAQTTKISSAPDKVRKEAAAAYLAYQGRFLAFHQNSPNFDLLLSECARHNRGTTW